MISGSVERNIFYSAVSGDSVEQVDQAIEKLEKIKKTPIVKAYIGALYIKKAGFLKVPKEKLDVFKQGQELLDNEIQLQPNNVEMRFVRLMMQEQTPKVLNYKNNINEDKKKIVQNFGKIDSELQAIIRDYAKTSKILKPEELK